MIFSSLVPENIKKGILPPDYLAGRFTYHSREEWCAIVKAGRVLRDGKPLAEDDPVFGGQTISYDAGEFEEPAADLQYRIVYEDEWLLGIDKPGNLLVHRTGKSVRNNLIYQLRWVHVPAFPTAHSVHRLDRDTSGVILVAKDDGAGAAFGRMILAGGLGKTYRAVVMGRPSPQEIDLPIGKLGHEGTYSKFCIDKSGKNAVTHIVEAKPVGADCSLLTIEPVTGRTHQIRVHLAAIGAPIVGDRLYTLSDAEYRAWLENPGTVTGRFPISRHALHCERLQFVHPYTKKECSIEAELPTDLQELIDRLSKQ
jgi:RluA family pseudouridine synthase